VPSLVCPSESSCRDAQPRWRGLFESHPFRHRLRVYSRRRFSLRLFVDVADLADKPMPVRSPAGDHPITATLKARVEALKAELAKVEDLVGQSSGGL
jgi:hypothetical protein